MGRHDFAGRTIVVTGGGAGMGASHAAAFHAAGGTVVIADVRLDAANSVARRLGERAAAFELDVSSERSWDETVSRVMAAHGRIDVLVNNAGILRYGSVETHSAADFRDVLETNVIGTFLGMKTVLPIMRAAGRGSVINIGSIAALVGHPDGIAYGASKWAVRGATKAAAVDMAGTGVRVNAVHPGFIRTAMSAETSQHAVQGQAIQRFGEVAEVTEMVLFLASEASSYCTGGDFAVDGGNTAGPVGSFRDDA